MIESILLALGTLFPIVNPISTAFVFETLTSEYERKKKLLAAFKSSLAAFIVLIVFLLVGNYILSFFDVTIYAFRVAGGLYLGKVAFEMLGKSFYKQAEPREHHESLAIIPLGIPLLAGPGAMAATLVLTEGQALVGYVAIALAIFITCILSFVILQGSTKMSQWLGRTGAKVVERIFGLLVLVIAAQFLFNGISGYLSAIGVV